jgi:Zn-dependent protease with chaperone function
VQRAVESVMGRLLPAAGRLAPPDGDLPGVEVLVLDSPVVNACALPGGLIAVHGGLLARLAGPEELAAVLAHELAHVVHHDSLNGLARALGISILLSVVGGGSETLLKQVLEQASALRYSRAVEERADRYALDLLVEARIDPGRLAEALSRLDTGAPPALLRYLDTHPDLDARIGRAKRRSVQAAVAAEPLGVEWPREALRALDGAGGAAEP